MTDQTNPDTVVAEIEALLASLRASKIVGYTGGGSVAGDGSGTMYGEVVRALVNPDGPAAARLIADLRAENARLAEVDRRCGKDNCMGQRVDGCRSWVSKEAFDRLTAERDALREALTPSGATKAAYIGEFHMGVTLRHRGQEDYRRIPIEWATIKEIMATIRERAALSQAPGTQPDSGAGPNPATRGSALAVASVPTRNEDQSDG